MKCYPKKYSWLNWFLYPVYIHIHILNKMKNYYSSQNEKYEKKIVVYSNEEQKWQSNHRLFCHYFFIWLLFEIFF